MSFPGNSAARIHDRILNRAPVAASKIRPAIPAKLEEIIGKALEKDRTLRYQSAADIRTDLQRLKRDTDSSRLTAATSAEVGVQQRRGKGNRWKVVVAAALAVVAIAVSSYFYPRRTAKLTNKDTIVLADFTNTTGDPVFDGTLRQGLSVQLEQSPFLNLLSDERIAQTLALMEQPKDTPLSNQFAGEVCQRTASTVTIRSSIASLGSQYVLGLKTANCHNGDSLAEVQVTASGKEQVLKALGDAAAKLREKLGESLGSVQKYDTPLEMVTTASLPALNAYGLGLKARREKGDADLRTLCVW